MGEKEGVNDGENQRKRSTELENGERGRERHSGK